MRKPVPVIQESADALKARLKHEPSRAKRQRLHALYLVASRHATHRCEVADLLGVSRNTIGRWFATYAVGGLDAVLQISVPAGKQPALSPTKCA
ncbi:MAG: hypothetical protein KatS3mg057_1458 [Herpetosiphonaceae bacterium]|nr:MAG: hypothetical protein KatS3mg057_1458 [Herpetosiphonaceae bacterium]